MFLTLWQRPAAMGVEQQGTLSTAVGGEESMDLSLPGDSCMNQPTPGTL